LGKHLKIDQIQDGRQPNGKKWENGINSKPIKIKRCIMGVIISAGTYL